MEHINVWFTVNYYFEGGFWIKPLKNLAERCFMKIRSKWVKLANPCYEEINALWYIRHPELKGVKMEGNILDEYDRYVARMSNHMIFSTYGKYPGNLLFKGMANPETADFRLVCRFNKNMYVDYDMTPLKD